jgi:hypothetical protein
MDVTAQAMPDILFASRRLRDVPGEILMFTEIDDLEAP